MTDAEKIALSLFAKPLAAALIIVTVAVLALAAATHLRHDDAALAAKRDTVRIADSVLVVRAETVTVRQRVVTHWDSVVRNVTDTQVVIQREQPDTVTVPVEVVRRDEAKDALILSLYRKDSTQEWRIASRDQLYAADLRRARGPRWGYGLTLGYGCGSRGCGPQVDVGLTYQAPFPKIRLPFGR